VKCYWLEEDGSLLFANGPSRIAPFVISTDVPCPVKNYCVPLSDAELAEVQLKVGTRNITEQGFVDAVVAYANSAEFPW